MAGLGGTFQGSVVLDPRQVQAILAGPDGPVAREMIRTGKRVQTEAKKRVGVYTLRPGPPRKRRPGTLRDRIVVRNIRTGDRSFAVLVGSEDPVALWHHEGTVPHVIVPRQRRRGTRSHLVFWSDRLGRVVRTKRVNHPGTRPNRFLTDSLRAVSRSRP